MVRRWPQAKAKDDNDIKYSEAIVNYPGPHTSSAPGTFMSTSS